MDRSSGNYTVFENGVYTACAPCKDDPKKPPLWQVKGARIIHDQTEKMLYFENAQLEFFGVPMAYLPYFSTPDPTVKRKTGFLMPGFTLGHELWVRRRDPVLLGDRARLRRDLHPAFHDPAGRAVPGRIPPAPDRTDPTRSAPTASTSSIPAPLPVSPATASSAAASKPRASSRSTTNGCGAGTASLLSDYYFMSDYRLAQYRDPLGSFLSLPTEAISQLYLTGVGNRSFFDAAHDLLSQLLG